MHWHNMTGSYDVHWSWFSTHDALKGSSHIWHEKYSLQYTKVLGFVACRVTSKRLDIGLRELVGAMSNRSKIVRGPTLVATL